MAQALCDMGPLSLLPTNPIAPPPSIREILTTPPAFAPGAAPHPLINQLCLAGIPGAKVSEDLRVRDITTLLSKSLEQKRTSRHSA